jgi:hypothetical protein
VRNSDGGPYVEAEEPLRDIDPRTPTETSEQRRRQLLLDGLADVNDETIVKIRKNVRVFQEWVHAR